VGHQHRPHQRPAGAAAAPGAPDVDVLHVSCFVQEKGIYMLAFVILIGMHHTCVMQQVFYCQLCLASTLLRARAAAGKLAWGTSIGRTSDLLVLPLRQVRDILMCYLSLVLFSKKKLLVGGCYLWWHAPHM
jgi:hypothetical protein